MAKYDTVTKPALNRVEKAVGGDLKILKDAVDEAVECGATLNDIYGVVGGVKEWNKIVRKIKKAKLA